MVVLGAVIVFVVTLAGCGGSDGASDAEMDSAPSVPVDPSAATPDTPGFVFDVVDAMEAVESELDGPQDFFEVTANDQFTNVFVAVDGGTAAVAYAWVDGELQPPAPKQEGADGLTFRLDDVEFDPDLVTAGVRSELPESDVDAISVYGDGVGATYVLAVTSPGGGFLDVVVGADGQVFSVDPV